MSAPRPEPRSSTSQRTQWSQNNRIDPRGGLASIKEILKRWIKDNRGAGQADKEKLSECWKQLVGEEIATHTRITTFSRGDLLVEVDSASLLNELSTYFQKDILESLRLLHEFQGIHKIRFRTGSF